MKMKGYVRQRRDPVLVYLVGFVSLWDKDSTFPPATALVAAHGPKQDVSRPVSGLLALFDMQRADVRPKHVVPK